MESLIEAMKRVILKVDLAIPEDGAVHRGGDPGPPPR
jgi:hypothetical protein